MCERLDNLTPCKGYGLSFIYRLILYVIGLIYISGIRDLYCSSPTLRKSFLTEWQEIHLEGGVHGISARGLGPSEGGGADFKFSWGCG